MGDAKALQSALDEVYFGEAGKLASTSMRQAKNMAIVIITLASRSAIAGGLLPEISFTMADAYIQRAENASSEGEAYSIARQLEFEYCELVHDIRNKKNNNQLVAQCKTLIFQRLHYKISNQDLADELRVNPSYLSRLFTKEEGINLKDYIIREKINYSKKQLIYTDDSYKDIANTYAFASQSYYGKMFKKWVGMTPREYRIRYADFDES
jgi:YesN/AraC family two-component response regulator